MAYVPGLDFDVFLSYPRADDPRWVDALEKTLRARVRSLLGLDVNFWQDVKNVRGGQNWVREIEDALASTAMLIAVLSPSYDTSQWCADERRKFLAQFPEEQGLEVDSFYRFLKLVRIPWEENGHLQFFPHLQQIVFHDEGSPERTEYAPGTDAFDRAVSKTAITIAAVLRGLRRRRERVYVATAPDRTADADALEQELRRRGYDVQPDGRRYDGYSDDFLTREMKTSVLSVHLLGPGEDPFSARVARLAAELGLRTFFTEPKDVRVTAGPKQLELLDAVAQGRLPGGPDLPAGFLHIVGDRRSMIDEVVAVLQSRLPAASPAPPGAGARLYVVCDASTPRDLGLARDLRSDILHRDKSLVVDLSEEAQASVNTARQLHLDRLRTCDGLLLLQEDAPPEWLLDHLSSFFFAESLLKRPPIRSKAILLDDPSQLEGRTPPGLVVRKTEDFRANDLAPFLAALRGPDGAHAGA